jgi:hypothetical protein
MEEIRNESQHRQDGTALLLTLVMSSAALLILASAMSWSATNTKQTERANSYNRCVLAAESATEKVVGAISHDFWSGGDKLVRDNISVYQAITPNSSDSPYWSNWEFNDANGNKGQTYVSLGTPTNYTVVDSAYAGLKGFASVCTVVSDARQVTAMQDVTAGVMQQLQLATIPIFQFAMYAPGDMEIGNGQPLTVTGRVHANGQLYVEPLANLTFQSDVTAVGDIIYGRNPLDARSAPSGIVVYQARKDPHVAALNLPIGVSNSPIAVREIIQPAPGGEDPNSPLGRQRYYNLTDLMIVATDSGITVTSGRFNGFGTSVPTNEVNLFVSTANSFKDWREGKTVTPIDLDIGMLTAWSATNNNVRVGLGYRDVASVYVLDQRTAASSTLPAVRVMNGRLLPPRGLTVATARPLYVWGHYNQTNDANLGTTNTSTALPASLAGDAITILSIHWQDSNSTDSLGAGTRTAQPTTVNAAILAGAVDTTSGSYSGGMENFPRFLEDWGAANNITYNGSMVKMFPSLYATNAWGKSDVYNPPKRDWAYDVNFNDSTRLPPLTPKLSKVFRSMWAAVAPNQITVASGP